MGKSASESTGRREERDARRRRRRNVGETGPTVGIRGSADEPTVTVDAARADDIDASSDGDSVVDDDVGPDSVDGATEVTAAANVARASKQGRKRRPRRRTAESITAGAFIGRYVVLEQIAVGGMGAVYKAYDPELDRKVAVKVVSTARDSTRHAAERLTREAKALAQLSHPNVVAVYDVGAYEQDVFVAMALVEGQTLRTWSRRRRRTPAEVAEIFLAAGRGLAAAHRAGLVHRDFKPDNVLIGDDGRVQVVDFGIARAQGVDDSAPLTPSLGDSSDSAESSLLRGQRLDVSVDDLVNSVRTPMSELERLTQAGTLVGTPAYMSPEQFRGEPVSAKSDQFSFCIALYGCLYGRRPFVGGNFGELKASVLAGDVRQPDASRRVPARLRRIVERGLSVAPRDRYESMDALLEELGKDPRARVRRVGLAAGVAGIVALTAVVSARGVAGGAPLCKGARGELAGRWDEGVRARARDAFEATGKPYATSAFDRARRAMDEYADGWVAARTEVCQATHVHGTQSEHLLDLRMRCLSARRDALSSLGSVFTDKVDEATVDEALGAALALPPLDGCFDDDALEAAVPLPTDPAVRASVESLGATLAYARALEDAGRYADGLEVVSEIAGAVDATEYVPLRAELRYLEGTLQLGAGDAMAAEKALRTAVDHGAGARNDALIADAWVFLLRALDSRAEIDEGLHLETVARVAVRRAGANELQRSRLQESLGRLYYTKGDYAEALEHQEEALALVRSALGVEHPEVAVVLGSIAATQYRRGDYAKARERFEQSLAIRERVFGSEHPIVARSVYRVAIVASTELDYERSEQLYRRSLDLFLQAHGEQHRDTALVLSGLGHLYYTIGRHAESEDALRRSLAIREQLLGPDHPHTGTSLAMLGTLFNYKEDFDAAEDTLRRALAVWEAKLGTSHAKLAFPLVQLGVAHQERGDMKEAMSYYERALSVRRESLGYEHPEVASTYVFIGDALVVQGRYAEAVDTLERALDIRRKALGPDDPSEIGALRSLGEAYLGKGEPARAAYVLERAVGIRGRYQTGDPYDVARTDFALARALWPGGRHSARARALAEGARDAYAADARPSASERRVVVERWLARHPAPAK